MTSRFGSSGGSDDGWMEAYTAVLSRAPAKAVKKDGPGCCPICCTLFSIFGSLFLFVIAAAMKNHYHYLHIEGDLNELSKGVTYAGLVYLVFAIIALFFWVRGIVRSRASYEAVA